nr:unnamed protein product [Callosobruchus analis]
MVLSEGRRIIRQEHIALIEEPKSSSYHLTIKEPGPAANIVANILSCLEAKSIDPKSIKALVPIGCLLTTCERRAVKPFQAIETDLPEADEKDLSTNQQYLYQINCAIRYGTCPDKLSKKNLGKLSHAHVG